MNIMGSQAKSTRRYGFTLLEILISFLILSIAVFSIIGIFPYLIRFSESSRDITIATSLAQDKLDEIRGNNGFISTEPVSDNPGDLDKCTRSWWGGVPEGSSTNSLQEIRVRVTWTHDNEQKSVELKDILGPAPGQ